MKKKAYRIELSTEAETDFDKSYHYYFGQNSKIADAFFLRINHSLELITKNPQIFPLVHKEVRKYVVKRFPFVIYYRVKHSSIQIIAIFHTSRNPEKWNSRI